MSILTAEKEHELFQEALDVAQKEGLQRVYGYLQKRIYEILRAAGVPLVGNVRKLVGKTAWNIYSEVFKLQGKNICEALVENEKNLKNVGVDVKTLSEIFTCPVENEKKE